MRSVRFNDTNTGGTAPRVCLICKSGNHYTLDCTILSGEQIHNSNNTDDTVHLN